MPTRCYFLVFRLGLLIVLGLLVSQFITKRTANNTTLDIHSQLDVDSVLPSNARAAFVSACPRTAIVAASSQWRYRSCMKFAREVVDRRADCLAFRIGILVLDIAFPHGEKPSNFCVVNV